MSYFKWLTKIFGRNINPRYEPRLTVSNRTRNAELGNAITIADQASSRRRGLLHHQSLASGEGLWIVPCEAIHTFGMKFSIDLVYLDRSCRVIKVKANVPPRRISACLSAHSVMELACGTIRRTQTAPGDMLDFNFISAIAPHKRQSVSVATAIDS